MYISYNTFIKLVKKKKQKLELGYKPAFAENFV